MIEVLECLGVVLALIRTRCVPKNAENEVLEKAENHSIDATRAYGRPCGRPYAILLVTTRPCDRRAR